MNAATDFEVPISNLPDGRQFIAASIAVEVPEVGSFVRRLSNYWQYDMQLCGWVGPALTSGGRS